VAAFYHPPSPITPTTAAVVVTPVTSQGQSNQLLHTAIASACAAPPVTTTAVAP